jgi:hypothetical protein
LGADYNNGPSNSISSMPAVASTSDRLSTVGLCKIYFCRLIGETYRFFAASGVELAQTNQDLFHCRRAAFFSQSESKVDNILQG